MSKSPPDPHFRFCGSAPEPRPLRLVPAPVARPSDPDFFPFRRAVMVATAFWLAVAAGAGQWLVRRHLAEASADQPAAAVSVRTVNPERRADAPAPRKPTLERREVQPPAPPRSSVPIPALAIQPEELVMPEWEAEPREPFEHEVDEKDNEPFPTARIEPPKLTRTEPKPKATPKPAPRTSRRPTPAANIPSSKPAVRAARVVRRQQPRYPTSARRAGIEGRVVLTVQVRSDGRVGSVRVSQSSGHATLDSAAISAVKRWSFAPETRGGKPVSSLLNVPFRFSLR